MNEITVAALADELEKIAITLPPPAALKGYGKFLKYPLMIGGGVLGWEHLKRMKRRYDIGRQLEEQMAARGQ